LEGTSGQSYGPTPLPQAGLPESLLPRTVPRWLLKISKDGDAAVSLGNLCQCCHIQSIKVFPDVQMAPAVFQVVLVASYFVTGNNRKEPGSIFFAPSPQVFIHIDKIP